MNNETQAAPASAVTAPALIVEAPKPPSKIRWFSFGAIAGAAVTAGVAVLLGRQTGNIADTTVGEL